MRLLAMIGLMSAGVHASADISFDWPVDCKLGETCFIQNYVDRDPSPDWADFTCGHLSYDGHKGTDIALPLRSNLEDGVAVLAAAPGVVQGKRDGMPDKIYEGEDLSGKDCGNGVVIDHGDGWVSQYCHLRQGSVVVGAGATVEVGQKLGEIGLSGRTEFPHLHFAVRKDGAVTDPFSAAPAETCDAPDDEVLWADPVPYGAGGLMSLGFWDRVPEFEEVKTTSGLGTLPTDGPLVLSALVFGAQEGDALRFAITGPAGQVFEHTAEFDRNRAQAYRAGGKRAPDGGWARGTYTGEVALVRAGVAVDSATLTVEID